MLLFWMNNYPCDFNSEKMRFTILIFLEVCSKKPSLATICYRMSQAFFSLRPEFNNCDISWAIPDPDSNGGLVMNHIHEQEYSHQDSKENNAPSSDYMLFSSEVCRSVLENESDTIAQQLCIMEWDLFKEIRVNIIQIV